MQTARFDIRQHEGQIANQREYSNPTSGFLAIDFEENQTQIDFIFYNATGEIVEQRKQQNFLSAKFQLQFEPGVYFLEITNDRFEKSVLKVIKE